MKCEKVQHSRSFVHAEIKILNLGVYGLFCYILHFISLRSLSFKHFKCDHELYDEYPS